MTKAKQILEWIESKAGFDPNQSRDSAGRWGSGGNIIIESTEAGGERYSFYDDSKEIAHLNTYLTDNFDISNPADGNYLLIIDNVFVDEKHQRKGLATKLFDNVLKNWDGKVRTVLSEDYLGNAVYYDLPVNISLGMTVSYSGSKAANSVLNKIKLFNIKQNK